MNKPHGKSALNVMQQVIMIPSGTHSITKTQILTTDLEAEEFPLGGFFSWKKRKNSNFKKNKIFPVNSS